MREKLLLLALLLPSCTLANSLSSVQDTPVPEPFTVAPTAAATTQPAAIPTLPARTPNPTFQPSATSLPVSNPKTPIPVRPLTLQVKSPLDESMVNASTITVIGTTSPNAVVSVNGQLATVDATGNFQLAITLDEGPNVIEIVASDVNGNELSTILSVIYQP